MPVWSIAAPTRSTGQEGHESIVRLCRDLEATDVDWAMVSAPCNCRESIVCLCHDWGGEDFDTIMAHVAGYGHIWIFILCRRWGATDLECAMTCVKDGNHIVELCYIWAIIDSD